PAHEDRDHEVRRLQLAVRAGNASRLDGGEAKRALRIGGDAPEAAPAALEGFVLVVLGIRILARGVRLPDLDQAVVPTHAVAVDQPAGDRDALAFHPAPGDVARGEPVETDVQVGADGLMAARVEAQGIFSIGVSSRPRSTMSKR